MVSLPILAALTNGHQPRLLFVITRSSPRSWAAHLGAGQLSLSHLLLEVLWRLRECPRLSMSQPFTHLVAGNASQ